MQAVLFVGHGSLRSGSGSAMFRLAARTQVAGVVPIVGAGFLNYSRPQFTDALARCVARGASRVVIQPYFLIPGKFVNEDVARLPAMGQMIYPGVRFALAQPFGDHPALAQLVLKRAAAAREQRAAAADRTGLLIMAHGSPNPTANRPIYAVAGRIMDANRYAAVEVCFMGLNQPGITEAIDDMVARGIRQIMAMPYFLQLGGHVAEDLPAIIDAARTRHPTAQIILTEHLAYDPLLVAVIADRAREALTQFDGDVDPQPQPGLSYAA